MSVVGIGRSGRKRTGLTFLIAVRKAHRPQTLGNRDRVVAWLDKHCRVAGEVLPRKGDLLRLSGRDVDGFESEENQNHRQRRETVWLGRQGGQIGRSLLGRFVGYVGRCGFAAEGAQGEAAGPCKGARMGGPTEPNRYRKISDVEEYSVDQTDYCVRLWVHTFESTRSWGALNTAACYHTTNCQEANRN